MSASVTIGQCLSEGKQALQQHTDNAYHEALLLLQYVTNTRKEFLLAHTEDQIDQSSLNVYQQSIQRRQQGEPLAYITQEKEFWSLPLFVDQNVLIPRPETELLIEIALEFSPRPEKILDLGTGSGCIALALASEFPDAKIIAADISSDSLNIAQHNAAQLHIDHIEFVVSDWFASIYTNAFDLIISNPPYIAESDEHIEQHVKKFEPDTALFSPANGLADIQLIIEQAHSRLIPGGKLLIEHGWQQAKEICHLMRKYGYYEIITHNDLQGHARATSCIKQEHA